MRDGGEKLIGALLVSVIKLKDVPLKTLVVTESSPFIYWATQYTAYAAWVMAGFPLVAPTAFYYVCSNSNIERIFLEGLFFLTLSNCPKTVSENSTSFVAKSQEI